jgi:predicted Fe-Mo cluster-binding NifX family protein
MSDLAASLLSRSMKIALPIYSGRISPVFDVARQLWLTDTAGAGLPQELPLEGPDLTARTRRLAELGVDVLICGAISRPLENMLLSAGIQVIPNTCGPVETVLAAYLAGQLGTETFLMPGCCGRRRCRGGRGNGPGQQSATSERRCEMPRGNGTGPQGQGPRTGRGLGPCAPGQAPQPSQGGGNATLFGQGRGAGQGRGLGQGGGRGTGRGRNR